MSHDITAIDRQQGIEMAWHKLTEVLPEINLRSCFLSLWDVKKSPMKEPDGSVSEYQRIVCTDNPSIRIGAPVADSYGLVTNKDFLETVADAIRGIKGAKVSSVGSVSGRGKIFVSVQLDDLKTFKAAGRTFEPFLNFISSHDQSSPFAVNASNICTVCANTFGMNLSASAGQRSGIKAAKESAGNGVLRVRLKHSKNVAARLENVPEVVDGFMGAQAEFKAAMDMLAAQPIKVDDANALFVGFLNDRAKPEPMSTRRANQVFRLMELFVRGAGNRGENLSDVFSAGTDYYSHESAGGSDNPHRQLASSDFGAGATAKSRLFSTLLDSDRIAATMDEGRAVLAARN